MPADYKFEHLSTGRLKALMLAQSDLRDLYKDLNASKVIAPEIIERLRVIRALIARAANSPLGHAEIKILERLLGKGLGTEKA
jgi:hypothetical protein